MKSSTGRMIFASAILFLLLLWVFVTFLETATDNQLTATEATVTYRLSRSKFHDDEIDTDIFRRFLAKYGSIPPRVSEVALALPPSDKNVEMEIMNTQNAHDDNEVNKSQKVKRDDRSLKWSNPNNDTVQKVIKTKPIFAKLGLNKSMKKRNVQSKDVWNKSVSKGGIINSVTESTHICSLFYVCNYSNSVRKDHEVAIIKPRNRFHVDENKNISLKTSKTKENVSEIFHKTFLNGIVRNNSKYYSEATGTSSHQVRGRLEACKMFLVNCSQQRVITKRHLRKTPTLGEESRIQRPDFCPSQPILSVKDGSGKLGSRLWQYASLWTLPRALPRIDRLPFIPRRLLRTLRRVFVNISMPVLEDIPIHCKYRQQLMNSRPLKQDSFRPMSELLRRVPPGAPVLLRRSVVLPEPVLPLLPELRRQLRFRPKLVAVAQHSLRQFREKRAPEAVDVRFVGTFVVRGKPTRANHLLRDPPGVEYLEEVLQSYRNEPQRTLFVVASDDLRWCKRHLAAGKNDILLVHTSSPQTLALLSACNTSLVDQSHLGLWAAFLSGQPSRVIPSDPYLDSFLSQLPGWSLLPQPKMESHSPNT